MKEGCSVPIQLVWAARIVTGCYDSPMPCIITTGSTAVEG